MNLTKILSGNPFGEPRLTKRIAEGWSAMGAIERPKDKRTLTQLRENIDFFAKTNPEVEELKKQLQAMPKEHIGVASDICELANLCTLNLKNIVLKGKNMFQILLEKIIKASKNNPEAIELSKAIIDNSDPTASKFALISLSHLFDIKEAAGHMKATVPLVADIAQDTLKGGLELNYEKEKRFANGLLSLISPDVQLEKLQLLPKLIEFIGKTKLKSCVIEAFPFVTSKTPMKQINKNMEIFKKTSEKFEGKNITEFLDKNI